MNERLFRTQFNQMETTEKQALMERITDLALSAPPHTVVPYANIPKKQYPRNILNEVSASHETTCD